MITKKQYVEFLISTQKNSTCSYLAAHLGDVSHESVTDFLEHARFPSQHLWELVCSLIPDTSESFLLVDASVQNKQSAQAIELVKLQYSGTEHDLVRGIGVVNLVQSSGTGNDYYPIDYRIYAPE